MLSINLVLPVPNAATSHAIEIVFIMIVVRYA
jgi:hypothetical protein